MINGKRVLVIVPAWEEAESIGDTVREIIDVLPEVDVLVVDDGSTDRTSDIAREAGATVTRLPYNLGVGGAMRLGYLYAKTQGYDVAVQIDADGQHDPRYLPKLVDRLDESALVIGARFAGEGDYTVRGPRKWSMLLLSFVLSKLAKRKLTDTTSGFRACNRDLIELFASWYPVEYLGDTVETTVRVIRLGYKIEQVPVAMRPRAGGTPSQSPARAMIYLGRAIMTLLLALNRR
ncbi:glycosyltransferase family 2 protein [Yinghuangia soli]|uniref:Glycosyltransferase family 2 protein n=1 Tax=Yinghuangia soli TaxID=2908204 RepID=A0AA41U274_9ACTN|nr:glycosyltransferase family 2 protein [Yinghuangia soli]MCF2526829.1 glycosyltransferase family 2 protein [Yinghuangia soli]